MAISPEHPATPAVTTNVLDRVGADERVRAAQELHQARDHLRAVTDSMGEALCTLDDAGHVSYMNAAAERLLGWNAQELSGQTLHEATHYRHPDGSHYPIEDCPLYAGHKARAGVRVADDMFIRRDGSGLAVSWVLTPFDSSTGSNSVIVFTDNTLAKAAQEKLQLEIEQLSQARDLHEALQEQRFEMFAQPIIDLSTGATVSHELLLRMRECDGGIRTPGAFLPVAERCGLIRELDRWVIRQAAQLAGDGHHVELNLSATSLGDPDLYDDFAAALAEYGAEPALMVIELTETALMHDETTARTFIERVRALGCELALDDFGTGFGGFGYLKRLPVDYLKIDIEFVRDLCTNAASRHVVEAVVNLARAFGQRTVAEGVEDEPTLSMIREMGVDLAQGFGIGCPAPLADTLLAPAFSLGDERDHAGEQRDQAGEQRDQDGEQRDRDGEQRDRDGEQRDRDGQERDHQAQRRDQAGEQRDQDGEQRDHDGEQRDQAGVRRDRAAVARDRAGVRRDDAAEQRDRAAERCEALERPGTAGGALDRSALARREAASDRLRALQDRLAGAGERSEAELDRVVALADRRAGAGERLEAELDRGTALADRGAGAGERVEAELDRDTALADRGASARDRKSSSHDELTGAYVRGAGMVELEREIATARHTVQPLVLAFVDVDGLKSVNDLDGHAAGDRMLREVAETLRSKLRSQDLVIRYGGDEFVCAIRGLTMIKAARRFALVDTALRNAAQQGSVTVGLAQLQAGESPDELVARADAALYRERQRQRVGRG